MKRTPIKRKRNREREALLREIKAEVTLRDGHRCRHCGDTWFLHLHHVWTRARGSRIEVDVPENCILLCSMCHDKTHAGKLPYLARNIDDAREIVLRKAA